MIADTEAWLSVLELGQCFNGLGVVTVQSFFFLQKKLKKKLLYEKKVGFQLWGANLGLLLTKSIKLKFLAVAAQNASVR